MPSAPRRYNQGSGVAFLPEPDENERVLGDGRQGNPSRLEDDARWVGGL